MASRRTAVFDTSAFASFIHQTLFCFNDFYEFKREKLRIVLFSLSQTSPPYCTQGAGPLPWSLPCCIAMFLQQPTIDKPKPEGQHRGVNEGYSIKSATLPPDARTKIQKSQPGGSREKVKGSPQSSSCIEISVWIEMVYRPSSRLTLLSPQSHATSIAIHC